ncbi:MAG: LuxR C-terminal-related transcriptional regulator, partial [Chloroflexi bacterium]|nr:LuxR C-terminal-related transcriptional regulator [Chloroflexota bacterium]
GYRYIIKAFVDPSESPTLNNRLQEVAQARKIFYQIGFPRGHLISMYVEAWIRQACADSKNVLTMYEAAVGFFRSNRSQFTVQNVLTRTLYGDLLYFHDQIQEARIVLQQAAEISQQLEKPADSVVYHATLRLQLCDIASGIRPQIKDETDEQQWRQFASVTPLASNITYLRILRDIKLGRLDRVQHTLSSFENPAGGVSANTPLVQRISQLTYEVHTNPNFDQVEAMLCEYDDYCVQLGWTAFSMQARVLRLVHALKRDTTQWDLHLLDALLTQIESTGMHRYVLDFPQLALMLNMSKLPFADVLLQKIARHSHSLPADPFNLTHQEVLVLRRIADGRNTDEIALDMQITPGTVRSHVRNAFLKMNVHHRAEAIKVARDAGLFDAS